jgi:hypothetical protein
MAALHLVSRFLSLIALSLITGVKGEDSNLDLGLLDPCITLRCPPKLELNNGSQAALIFSNPSSDGFSNCCV